MEAVRDKETGAVLLAPSVVLLDEENKPELELPDGVSVVTGVRHARSKLSQGAGRPPRRARLTRNAEKQAAMDAAKETVDAHFSHLPRKTRRSMARALAKQVRQAAGKAK